MFTKTNKKLTNIISGNVFRKVKSWDWSRKGTDDEQASNNTIWAVLKLNIITKSFKCDKNNSHKKNIERILPSAEKLLTKIKSALKVRRNGNNSRFTGESQSFEAITS